MNVPVENVTEQLKELQTAYLESQRRMRELRVAAQKLRAKFDAAQTYTGNEEHWSLADRLSPSAVASYEVRAILRSRSRYEFVENNPLVHGNLVTICNDFANQTPHLEVFDDRIDADTKQRIEDLFASWADHRFVRLRHVLWKMRMAKIVDGETFAVLTENPKAPFGFCLRTYEADQVTDTSLSFEPRGADGIRYDQYGNPTRYYLLEAHPGDQQIFVSSTREGRWIPAESMIHWFKKQRDWPRGIPELTASIPLCAILRRYTAAVVRNAELAASISGLLETEMLPGGAYASSGGDVEDWESFPFEIGMITALPRGAKLKQTQPVPLGAQYDAFAQAIIKQILRPLQVPYNIVQGSSADSNMASAIVDTHIYKEGQNAERKDCNEVVLEHIFEFFWRLLLSEDSKLRRVANKNAELFESVPKHRWRWGKVGLDHTDPQKVAFAITTLLRNRILTMRDVQENYMDRSLEQWQQHADAEKEIWEQLFPPEETTLTEQIGVDPHPLFN